MKVRASEYVAFITSPTGKGLVRDVAMMCEPPLESFNNLNGGLVWPESIVASARLVSLWPGGGVNVDPRPYEERTTGWWREDCEVRDDWWARFTAGVP